MPKSFPWLYFLLNMMSLSVPVFYTFYNTKFGYASRLKKLLPSILFTSILFLIWDYYFTKNGIWGFNPDFHLPILIGGMPIDEWMFFICIPYASIFIHEVLKYLLPKIHLNDLVTTLLSYVLIFFGIYMAFTHQYQWYTFYDFSVFSLVLLIGVWKFKNELQYFYWTFLVILIPFFIVNGVLTGTMIPEPVVWYNDQHNLGIRMGTIPFEDIFYAFSMIFISVMIFNFWERPSPKDS